MKVLLDIKDSKAHSLLEVLKGLDYVKAKTINEEKAQLMEEIKEAVSQVRLAKKGKIKLKSMDEFLNEL
jgi:hypothetical protein